MLREATNPIPSPSEAGGFPYRLSDTNGNGLVILVRRRHGELEGNETGNRADSRRFSTHLIPWHPAMQPRHPVRLNNQCMPPFNAMD